MFRFMLLRIHLPRSSQFFERFDPFSSVNSCQERTSLVD